MWREKNIYFTEHDIYFNKLMFISKNMNLELKSASRTKYIFYRILLYDGNCESIVENDCGHDESDHGSGECWWRLLCSFLLPSGHLGWMIMKALPGGIWNYVVAILGWRLCIIVGTNKLDSVATYYFTLVYLRSPLEYFGFKKNVSSSHWSVFDEKSFGIRKIYLLFFSEMSKFWSIFFLNFPLLAGHWSTRKIWNFRLGIFYS